MDRWLECREPGISKDNFVSSQVCEQKSVIFLSWLCVPSTFQIFRGTSIGSDVILSRWSRFLHMKLLVAPKSIRTSLSAVACADSNNTGIRMDLYLLLYTLIRSAVAQAVRFRH